MEDIILTIPIWLSIVLVIILSCGAAVSIPLILRKKIGRERLSRNNEVAGFKYAVIGAIYGVLIAFITMVVYEEYKESRYTIENEARAISSLYRVAGGFSEPVKSSIRKSLTDYAESVVREEWPLLKEGKEHPATRAIVTALWNTYIEYSPGDGREATLYDQSLTLLNELYTARRHRMVSSRNEIPGLMWFVILLGGLITVTFTFFFAAPSLNAQIMMTAMVTMLITMTLLLITHLDNPFHGPISVSGRPYLHVLQVMKEYLPRR